MAIRACQAGKHVYVEKPVCHTIWEGRQMVKAMQKHKRIVAAGFQNRSDVGLGAAIPMIHGGHIGEIKQARGPPPWRLPVSVRPGALS
jgi:predicted dehydrogenase